MNASPLADEESSKYAEAANAAQLSATGIVLARVPLSVRWGDLDAFNHVNNAAFLEYVQEARLTWMAALEGAWLDESIMPVVAAAHVNFRNQLTWPCDIVVELIAGRIGRSSVTIAHRIISATDPGRIFADGETVLVWIDRVSGHSIPLPGAILAVCQSALASASAATTSK